MDCDIEPDAVSDVVAVPAALALADMLAEDDCELDADGDTGDGDGEPLADGDTGDGDGEWLGDELAP